METTWSHRWQTCERADRQARHRAKGVKHRLIVSSEQDVGACPLILSEIRYLSLFNIQGIANRTGESSNPRLSHKGLDVLLLSALAKFSCTSDVHLN